MFLVGLQMLMNKSDHQHSSAELEDAVSRSSVAVVPLAIPVMAGPGTMATVLVAANQTPSVLSKLEISVVILAIAALSGLLFSFSAAISNWLGKSGMGVVTRIMGLILATIAVSMLADGLKGLFPVLAG